MVEAGSKEPHCLFRITMFSDDQEMRDLFRYLKGLGENFYRLWIRLP